jgi:4-amino-4-deoxy-L-arabinose transferase-like glycosyltransferase
MEGRSDLSLVLPDTAIIHSPWRAALCTARQKPHAVAMLLVLGAMLALRLLYAGHFEYDTDEAQHLHVVWGWTNGQLAYRDFFDNHAPLFHLLCAPLLRILGERADVLLYMRLAMFPIYGVMLYATFRIGERFFGRPVALWSAMLLSIFPLFFLKALEYRTDDLWAMVWVLVIWLIATRPLSARWCFVIGLLAGAAFGISLKTTFLLVGLIGALVIVAVLAARDRSLPPLGAILGRTLAGVAGLALIPAAIVWFFVAKGAWRPMY